MERIEPVKVKYTFTAKQQNISGLLFEVRDER